MTESLGDADRATSAAVAAPHVPHFHDLPAVLAAIESDIAYFRTKRLEPRVVHLIRRGVLSFTELFHAYAACAPEPSVSEAGDGDLDRRLRSLEDALDSYVVAIGTLTAPLKRSHVVIEDVRKERGDYDEFFRFAKRPHDGSVEARIEAAEAEIAGGLALVAVVSAALVAAGETDEASLAARRQELVGQGYRNGARIVARAWVDPEFRQRLVETGREAVRDLDIPPGRLGRLGVAESTEAVHHVVVCTLCSCYPHDLLGDPPWWYRSDEYKTRIVADPRSALRDMFDLEVPGERAIRVHDSTSDLRWMVLPRRPAGTEGWSEEQLACLVTPESLVGTAEASPPEAVNAPPKEAAAEGVGGPAPA